MTTPPVPILQPPRRLYKPRPVAQVGNVVTEMTTGIPPIDIIDHHLDDENTLLFGR